MAWQGFVDEQLMCDVDGQRLSAAAIVGHDGSLLAQSEGFPQYTPEEITGIMKEFEEPGSLAATGLFIGGTKYMVISSEPGVVIHGKKGSGGIVIKKTVKALIIGIYDEPMSASECSSVVQKLGDYLIQVDY